MTGEPDPPWTRNAVQAVGRELGAFVTTLWAIVSSPARFADEWAAGRRRALNPLAFMLNALAVIGPWRALWARLVDPNPPTTPLWFELAKPALPVVMNVSVTALFHLLLLPLGARRKLRSSLAMALYVSGGPLAVANFLVAPLVLYGFLHRNDPTIATSSVAANLSLLVLFFVYLIVMEASLHRIARWRAIVAALLAWVIVRRALGGR